MIALLRACAFLVGTMALASGVAAQLSTQPSALVKYLEVDRFAAVEGVVEAIRQSTLSAQIAGRIVGLAVKAGDTVKAGQILVRIDPRSAVQAEAATQGQAREAQANLVNAKAKYERSQRLFAEKFISRAALDQSEAEYLAAQAQVTTAAALAEQSTTSKSFTTIVAPYNGVVASTEVEVGEMATTGKALITVFDPHELRVSATLPQVVLAKANLGVPVSIEIPTLNRTLVARRVTVIPIADTRTHTTRVRLDLPESPSLMPGQYARASIVIGHARVLAIPRSAVLKRSEVTAVYALDANNHVQLRQVRIGEAVGDGLVEVLAGLDAGERVVIEPIRAGIEASKRGEGEAL